MLKKIVKSPFFTGSLVMVLGSNVYNFGQFVFHFLTGRILGKALYGDVAAIISILGLLGIVQLSISLTIVKYIASSKNASDVSNFSKWIYKWSLYIAGAVFVVMLILSPFLTRFLNITDVWSVLLLAPIMFFFLLANSLRSILQGLLRFGGYVISLVSEAIFKIVFALVFIYLGFSVLGASGGMLAGVIASFVLAYRALREYLVGKRGLRPEIGPLVEYTFPVFIQGLALTSMYSTDLILVKHFFTPQVAGMYASLAVLGRVVFFGTSPVTQVMFPIVARKHAHGESYHKYLFMSLGMVVVFALTVIGFYFFVPKLPIGILYGAEYLDGSTYLWWFALFMGLLGVSVNLIQFYLSIGKVRTVWLFIFAALIQAVGIVVYHPTVLAVIHVSIVSAGVLAFSLIAYYPFHHRGIIKANG